LVDRHRRAPADLLLRHVFDELHQLLAVGLAEQLAGPAETMNLVVGVRPRREGLNAVERRVRDAVEMLDRADAQVDVILRGRLLEADVRGGAESLLLRLVQHDLELIAIEAADLQPVEAVRPGLPDAGADFLRRTVASEVRPVPEQDARRDDPVRVALRAPQLRLVRVAADLARG